MGFFDIRLEDVFSPIYLSSVVRNSACRRTQLFHVAYVFIKMANSPRPEVWVLERSRDNGETFKPWQYFAETENDCETFFGQESLRPITRDDSVVCDTQFSKVVPLEDGEIVVSLLNNRPSANNFFNSTVLQEWSQATNVRLRFLRTKTLLAHLMSLVNEDPTVTRRYFYSIRDISIGGRCVCNGHADVCDITDPNDPYKLLCRCQHNTWNNEGGGVCQNCRHFTTGINCDKCQDRYYRPYGKPLDALDVCHQGRSRYELDFAACQCDNFYSTGNCENESGRCECKRQFRPPNCDACNVGYYDFPNCKPCDCHQNGTRGNVCEVGAGQCPCKANYAGKNCDACNEGYYKFPECIPCDCNSLGSLGPSCHNETGQCDCTNSYAGRTCSRCEDGYFGYPNCAFCSCDIAGTKAEICDKSSGACLCKEGYAGDRCDQCAPGFFGYPNCLPCNCSQRGSVSQVCNPAGKCPCIPSFSGRTCEQCSPGYHKYPDCIRCNCDPAGVLATFGGCGTLTTGELCECKQRVTGRICNTCKALFWNLRADNPLGCEDCNCHIPGVLGGLRVCDSGSGKCHCKPQVTSRRCDLCKDGSYRLTEANLFGCIDCDCDIGGSSNNICDKVEGRCVCRPRISGRKCDKPLTTHYHPTLHQYQYEVEDGYTEQRSPVRFGYDESLFPGYSWKGYAVFSVLQKEVLQDIQVENPSLYRVILRYVNPSDEPKLAEVKLIPDSPRDTEQIFMARLEPGKKPNFVTVSGPVGDLPSPYVIDNPGRWTVSIKTSENVFVDYFVLLPLAYYEATVLQQPARTACSVGEEEDICMHYAYPDASDFAHVRGEAGHVPIDDDRKPVPLFGDARGMLGTTEMALMDENSQNVHLDMRIPYPGKYVLLVFYHSPNASQPSSLTVEVNGQRERHKGKAVLYACPYTSLCRQVITDAEGGVAMFNLDDNNINVVLKGEKTSGRVGIDQVVAVPEERWHMDLIEPAPMCTRRMGQCAPTRFVNPPRGESVKVEFESGNEDKMSKVMPPGIQDGSTGLIYLDHQDAMVDITGKVPNPGYYVFLVHYYQPQYPEFEVDVLIQNGQFYEGTLPLRHCPSAAGCRAVIKSLNGGDTQFQILENFVLTLKASILNI
ncbi:unnamed protein product [Darwinula stevensoni]|uniref:Laminin subunit alpha n=1 Tax=Darwinula stevensoni TaxID=69355 RepID=A0A7R9A1Y3_9CRUS|nr:unnamed protein product [Darwinula stevensoni]CAG0878725.1 unnamed protein product [Darwinula stevensoni]